MQMPLVLLNGEDASGVVQVDSEDTTNQSASLDEHLDDAVVDDIFLDKAEDSNAMASGLIPEKGGNPPEKTPPLDQSSTLSEDLTLSQVLTIFFIHLKEYTKI